MEILFFSLPLSWFFAFCGTAVPWEPKSRAVACIQCRPRVALSAGANPALAEVTTSSYSLLLHLKDREEFKATSIGLSVLMLLAEALQVPNAVIIAGLVAHSSCPPKKNNQGPHCVSHFSLHSDNSQFNKTKT